MSLSPQEFRRYGRQMQVPEFNALEGQLGMKNAAVLVIGAGGLGSSAILYLAAAGVGKLGIMDFDTVETSNLHRQVIHDTSTVGMLKCESAKRRVVAINPHVAVETHPNAVDPHSGDILKSYHLVLDCTDNPATRYIISDLCVIHGKPLVSASALKAEGQLSILNFPPNVGPCYRCFYPTPPPAGSVSSCSDAGVIGSCVGLLGVMMATESTKILTGYYNESNFSPSLTMYVGYGPQQTLRNFKMRSKQPSCLCSGKLSSDLVASMDYTQWCGKTNPNVLSDSDRLDTLDFVDRMSSADIVLDVRPPEQYNIAHLPNTTNVPWGKLKKMDKHQIALHVGTDTANVLVLCRFGNASQLATNHLKKSGYSNVKDLRGGLNAYSRHFPFNAYW